MIQQTTLRRSVSLDGVGVHTNAPVRLSLNPADAGTGLAFQQGEVLIPAHWSQISASDWRTQLGGRSGAGVDTVEHVLAALAGLGVDNALIALDGPEAPALDGSAAPFVQAIDEAGIALLPEPRRFIEVLAPVRVAAGPSFAELTPGVGGLTLDVAIDYADKAVGQQSHALRVDPETFRNQIAPARTFGFAEQAEPLWRKGLALGASLDNTIVIAGSRVLNSGGLRFADEFVRHKMLDAIGDLALAGAPILGRFRSFRGGHRLNHALLETLFRNPAAWRWTEGAARGSQRIAQPNAHISALRG